MDAHRHVFCQYSLTAFMQSHTESFAQVTFIRSSTHSPSWMRNPFGSTGIWKLFRDLVETVWSLHVTPHCPDEGIESSQTNRVMVFRALDFRTSCHWRYAGEREEQIVFLDDDSSCCWLSFSWAFLCHPIPSLLTAEHHRSNGSFFFLSLSLYPSHLFCLPSDRTLVTVQGDGKAIPRQSKRDAWCISCRGARKCTGIRLFLPNHLRILVALVDRTPGDQRRWEKASKVIEMMIQAVCHAILLPFSCSNIQANLSNNLYPCVYV